MDVFQMGAGTSFHMNVNEVLANRASEIIGGKRGEYTLVHPNDHVNLGQSTNDVFPTAMRLSVLMLLQNSFLISLKDMEDAFFVKADEFDVAISPPLIDELNRVLTYPRVRKYLKASEEELEDFLRHLRTTAIVVEPQMTVDVVQKDPDDNRVLECALAGGASYIVSGNTHLLDTECYPVQRLPD